MLPIQAYHMTYCEKLSSKWDPVSQLDPHLQDFEFINTQRFKLFAMGAEAH